MASIKFDTVAGLQDDILVVASRCGRFSQVSDLDEALDAFGSNDVRLWTPEEKHKYRNALSMIQLHLSNDIL